MSILIKELSDNKFEITLNEKPITKHTVLLTDEYHDSLTKKKISKKKLLEYSFHNYQSSLSYKYYEKVYYYLKIPFHFLCMNR